MLFLVGWNLGISNVSIILLSSWRIMLHFMVPFLYALYHSMVEDKSEQWALSAVPEIYRFSSTSTHLASK